MSSTRIEWIDIARAIAILMVVLGHCIGYLDDPVNRFILAFHMPLFFFVSGLCVKCNNDAFIPFVKKKMRTLLVPQVTLAVTDCVVEGGVTLKNFLGQWFLLVLFAVSVIFYIIQKRGFITKMKSCAVVIFVDCILIVIMNIFEIHTLLYLEIIPMALLFYISGYLLKSVLERERSEKVMQWWFLAMPITVICSSWNTPVTMYNNGYGNTFLFVLGAASGIYMVCGLAKGLKKNIILSWIGKNSVIIYVLHFPLIKVLHFIGKILFPNVQNSYLYPANWEYFLIAIILLLPATYICNKWFGWMFGKRNV